MVTDSSFEKLTRSKANPEDENYDIRIDRGGDWWHEGAKIKRKALVKLFSTVLRYDEEAKEYWLITPAEKGRITVEDVPFVIVNYEYENNNLILYSNLEHKVLVSDAHSIERKNNIPYVVIRDNLLARINRAVYYDLIEHAWQEGNEIVISSSDKKWCLGKLDQ